MPELSGATAATDAERLQKLIQGFQFTQVLRVAVELGVPDILAQGPAVAGELAARAGVHAPSLERLMRALVSVGVFAEQEPRVFAQNGLSEILRAEHPRSLRAWSLACAIDFYPNWMHLGDVVRKGATVSQILSGTTTWDDRARDPEANRRFNDAMAEISRRRVAAFVERYDCSRFGTVVDVGGGNGALLAGILKANPGARGILFDQPHVVATAEARLSAAGVADRATIISGDFFESVPAGGDAYILSIILHDWDDDRAIVILRRCREAMDGHEQLLLLERVLVPEDPNWVAQFVDMQMLQGTGGRERARAEWQGLLARGSFRFERAVPFIDGGVCVIEAVPV